MLTKPCPEFNFRHKFSLLVVGPTQSGKTYFVQQILKHNRIVYEEQKSIRIFWYYNQWQECYEELKTSLGKSIRFERGLHFMNAYYKEIEKPFGYLLVDNKPDTPADQQILADLFGECYVYHFGVNSTEPTRVETKPVGKHSTATKITSSRMKPVQTVTWSDVPNDVWLKYTLGAPEVRKIPEGYVIIEMYNTLRNKSYQPQRGGVLINDENYWPVKLKHRSTGHIKWVNLHSDDPTVQSIVKETMAMENAARPNR